MKIKDNVEWLKSLKRQIGQSHHRDLWHFEQVIDETIENLETVQNNLSNAEDEQTTQLKPCPFCGSNAEFHVNPHENSDTTHWHKIYCTDRFGCGAEIGTALSGWQRDYEKQVEEFKQRWNRRVNNEPDDT
jgi:Lar family restriction alleviation protein